MTGPTACLNLETSPMGPMARQIKLGQIGNFMEGQVETLVKATTLEWEKRVKEATPVDTGRLRLGWESNIKPLEGEITNRVKYAEPVCYGTNLPASWKGQYRTRQGVVPGFPDLIGKELEGWVNSEYSKIVREG